SYDTPSARFDRFASASALLAALSGWWYAVSFVVLRNPRMSAIALMAGAGFASVALVALYERVKNVSAAAALWALMVVSAGLLGGLVHGGYDLAASLHPLSSSGDAAALSAVDPRGLLTFSATGVGIGVLSWLISERAGIWRIVSLVGYGSALLSVVL